MRRVNFGISYGESERRRAQRGGEGIDNLWEALAESDGSLYPDADRYEAHHAVQLTTILAQEDAQLAAQAARRAKREARRQKAERVTNHARRVGALALRTIHTKPTTGFDQMAASHWTRGATIASTTEVSPTAVSLEAAGSITVHDHKATAEYIQRLSAYGQDALQLDFEPHPETFDQIGSLDLVRPGLEFAKAIVTSGRQLATAARGAIALAAVAGGLYFTQRNRV